MENEFYVLGDELMDNVFIGHYAGQNMIKGKCNIFLGAHAGENETECNNTFILKMGDVELRETITKENYATFKDFINRLIGTIESN